MNTLATFLLFLLLSVSPLRAEEGGAIAVPSPTPVSEIASVKPAGPPMTDLAVAAQRATVISEELRCPVCQGLSAAASQAESAVAMRTRAQELVEQGYSDKQILDYFVSRYGEWILLEPPRHGRHWLVWLGPVLLLFFGALVVAWRMTSNAKAPTAPLEPSGDEDPYERAVLDELDRS